MTSDPAVRITVYGLDGSRLGTSTGLVVLELPRGRYRVQLERLGVVREQLIEHERETVLHEPGPSAPAAALGGGARGELDPSITLSVATLSPGEPRARYPGITGERNVLETWVRLPQDDPAADLAELDHAIAHVCILTGRSPHLMRVFPARGASIGRIGGDCDVLTDDGRMSRRHARIERSAAGWQLQDLGARNRGFVDGCGYGAGERIALTDGAVLRLGDTLMVFRASPPASDGKADSPAFPGFSSAATDVRRRIDSLAASDGHILIVGETGTGKDRVAHAIGELRAPHRFAVLDAAALDRDLARSPWFGHLRGALTQTTGDDPEPTAARAEGVVFLDEVGELPDHVQGDLADFLAQGSRRPGGSTAARGDARLIAATHMNLEQAVANGTFRRDLLAHLRAGNAPLELPPLRRRREDILSWTQLFLRECNRDPGPRPWTVGALECLLLYPWIDNLRELRGVVREVAAHVPSFPCGTEYLPAKLRTYRGMLRIAIHLAPPDEPIAPPDA